MITRRAGGTRWGQALIGLACVGCVVPALLLAADTTQEAGPQAVLKWKARQESSAYGYLVYRSEKREGPFLRISADIIHVRDREAETSSYEFVDRDVVSGKTYFYYLDVIENSGRKRRFSGVISKSVGDVPKHEPS